MASAKRKTFSVSIFQEFIASRNQKTLNAEKAQKVLTKIVTLIKPKSTKDLILPKIPKRLQEFIVEFFVLR